MKSLGDNSGDFCVRNTFLHFEGKGSNAYNSAIARRRCTLPVSFKAPMITAQTLMLRNIPNRLDSNCLLEALAARGFFATVHYDFLYLPIDTRTRRNLGYGFINFKTARIAAEFMAKLRGTRMIEQSDKLLCICLAKVQGLQQNIKAYNQHPDVSTMPVGQQPLIFDHQKQTMVRISKLPPPQNTGLDNSPR